MADDFDWDADFRRHGIDGIIVRDLELQSATVAYAPPAGDGRADAHVA